MVTSSSTYTSSSSKGAFCVSNVWTGNISSRTFFRVIFMQLLWVLVWGSCAAVDLLNLPESLVPFLHLHQEQTGRQSREQQFEVRINCHLLFDLNVNLLQFNGQEWRAWTIRNHFGRLPGPPQYRNTTYLRRYFRMSEHCNFGTTDWLAVAVAASASDWLFACLEQSWHSRRNTVITTTSDTSTLHSNSGNTLDGSETVFWRLSWWNTIFTDRTYSFVFQDYGRLELINHIWSLVWGQVHQRRAPPPEEALDRRCWTGRGSEQTDFMLGLAEPNRFRGRQMQRKIRARDQQQQTRWSGSSAVPVHRETRSTSCRISRRD